MCLLRVIDQLPLWVVLCRALMRGERRRCACRHSGPGKDLETVLGLDPKPLSVYILITVFA